MYCLSWVYPNIRRYSYVFNCKDNLSYTLPDTMYDVP